MSIRRLKRIAPERAEALNAVIDLYNELCLRGTVEMMPIMHERLRGVCVQVAATLGLRLEDASDGP